MTIATLAIFVIIPILSIPNTIVGMLTDRKFYKLYIALFSIVMGLLAYNMLPIPEYDLSRYYLTMEDYSGNNFISNIQSIFTRLDSLSYLFMYVISLSGNVRLLQFVGVSVGYYLLLSVLLQLCKSRKYHWVLNLTFVCIFLSTFEFIHLYSGLRNYIAIGLFIMLLYKDMIKTGRLRSWMYFIPALFHSSLIIPAILICLLRRHLRFISMIFVTVISMLLPSLALVKAILARLPTSPILESILDKLKWYDPNIQAMLSNDYFIFKFLTFVAILFVLYIVRDVRDKLSEKHLALRKFIYFMIPITLVMIVNTTFFDRYMTLLYFVAYLYYIYIYKLLTNRKRALTISVFTIIGLITLYRQYIYISLLSTHTQWLDFITSNIFSIW